MLEEYFPAIFKGYVTLACVMTLCMIRAYDVDVRRDKDDPEKRNFHFGGIIFIPWVWPPLLLFIIMIVILRALLYILFLGLTIFLLIVIRKPFLLTWLDKIATKIGKLLLEINNFLIKLMFGNFTNAPQSP